MSNTEDKPRLGYIPIAEFSEAKSIQEETVIEMIRDGFYSGEMIDGNWYVDKSELSAQPKKTQEDEADQKLKKLKSIHRVRNFSMIVSVLLLVLSVGMLAEGDGSIEFVLFLLCCIISGWFLSHRYEKQEQYGKSKFWAWVPLTSFIFFLVVGGLFILLMFLTSH